MPALADHLSKDRAAIVARLEAEFTALSPELVQRCVGDAWVCAEHLGLLVTPALVERVAREHLVGVVKSIPPSGR